ncbi:MAG: substrate-binding domain-containing protein [Lentisphaeria bacterium]|nr:substrate-binding domain-containing protein [Lentisphaeria bacterium]
MKHIFCACMFIVLFMVSGCGDNGGKKLKIGVSVPAPTHAWAAGVVWSAEQAEKRLEAANPDVDVIIARPGSNSADQVNRIENLLARNIDALVVMSQEPGPVSAICERAKKQGVYLVVVSNPLDKPVQDVFVNGDNRSFGAAAAEAMGMLLKGKGEIVVMEGVPCPINTDRAGAFKETLAAKYPGIKILASQASYWNMEKGLALMETYLQKFKKIDAVWAGDDDVLIGVLKAYEESKRKDVQFMVGGGGSKLIVKKILDKDPLVRATVTYSPRMLETGVEAALDGLRNGKKAKQKEIIIPSRIITHENARDHYFPDSVY